MEFDLGAVRAFVTVVDGRHFGAAAERLGLSQQAISKRIAKLEGGLGTTLLRRSRSGTSLTEDGAAFLTHARALVALADQAMVALQGRQRPLRVDVLGTRLAPTELVREFHEANPDVEIDIVTSSGLRGGRSALVSGAVDVSFARAIGVIEPPIEYVPAYLEPHRLLIGRKHRFANRRRVRIGELRDFVAWMPGNEPGSEWADFYVALESSFELTVDTTGPHFGLDHTLDALAASPERFTFGGDRMRVPWHQEIVQIPIVDPTPVYPWSMLWHRENRHPALPRLINHIMRNFEPYDPERHWLPSAEMQQRNFEIDVEPEDRPAGY